MQRAESKEGQRRSHHMTQRQAQREITDEQVAAALQREPLVLADGTQIYHGEDGVVVITAADRTLITTYWKATIGLAVFATRELTEQACQLSESHVDAKTAFPRSEFAGAVGSRVIGLVAIDDLAQARGAPDELIPDEFKEFARSRQIPDWEGTCGCDPDWGLLYQPPSDLHERLPGAVMLSGVELPTPDKGYPNLDVLGLLAKTHSNTRREEVLDRLQQRAVVEGGVAVHRSFLEASSFHSVGVSEHERHRGLPVYFTTAVIPADARVVEIAIDDDWARRLMSFYANVEALMPENGRFAALVPSDFDVADLGDPAVRDSLLPASRRPTRMLPCCDCDDSRLFAWTYEEQEFYRERGWPEPIRCKQHRKERKEKKKKQGGGAWR